MLKANAGVKYLLSVYWEKHHNHRRKLNWLLAVVCLHAENDYREEGLIFMY